MDATSGALSGRVNALHTNSTLTISFLWLLSMKLGQKLILLHCNYFWAHHRSISHLQKNIEFIEKYQLLMSSSAESVIKIGPFSELFWTPRCFRMYFFFLNNSFTNIFIPYDKTPKCSIFKRTLLKKRSSQKKILSTFYLFSFTTTKFTKKGRRFKNSYWELVIT